jgi:hypothetical protein
MTTNEQIQQDLETYHRLRHKLVVQEILLSDEERATLDRVTKIVKEYYEEEDTPDPPKPGSLEDRIQKFLQSHGVEV